MKDNASSAVKVTYYSKCLNENGPLQQTNKCDGLKVGTEVRFQAEVEVKACPENPAEWKQTFQIYPVGINESLVVDLEMICDCPCEHPGHPVSTGSCTVSTVSFCIHVVSIYYDIS